MVMMNLQTQMMLASKVDDGRLWPVMFAKFAGFVWVGDQIRNMREPPAVPRFAFFPDVVTCSNIWYIDIFVDKLFFLYLLGKA